MTIHEAVVAAGVAFSRFISALAEALLPDNADNKEAVDAEEEAPGEIEVRCGTPTSSGDPHLDDFKYWRP